MYSLSSQKKFWTFPNMDKLNELRQKQNEKFKEAHGHDMDVRKYINF